MRIDITPEGKFWVIEAGPAVIHPEPMPGGWNDCWAPVPFGAVVLARGTPLSETLRWAKIAAADNEVLATTWAEYSFALDVSQSLALVDSGFVVGPDPRD